MKKTIIILFLLKSFFAFTQNNEFNAMVDATISKTIELISVDDLKRNYDNYIILDTREINEYRISHLKNAKHVGYKNFNLKKTINQLPDNKPIVVYCSIGYRSEKIGEKLQKQGYTVFNLYGGIFNWKNKENIILNNQGDSTEKVHCYNKKWSKWLLKGTQIYE